MPLFPGARLHLGRIRVPIVPLLPGRRHVHHFRTTSAPSHLPARTSRFLCVTTSALLPHQANPRSGQMMASVGTPSPMETSIMHSLFILDEERINLDETCRLLGTAENPAHFTTALRAMNVGRKTPGGKRAYLEHLHVGGKIITSREAVERSLRNSTGYRSKARRATRRSHPCQSVARSTWPA